MNKIFILAFLLGATSAFAADGKDVGNGGDAVVCRNAKNKITSVQFYDHFEAKEKRQMVLDLGAATLSYEKKLDLLLARVKKINPSRARMYREWWSSFMKEAKFIKGSNLIDIPDTGGGFVPAGCGLEQLAVQQTVKFPGDSRYTINQDLWDLMDANSKAGLILHELILREATSDEVGQTNSINTRYLNAVMSTKAYEKMSLKSYIELLQLTQFKVADAQGGVPIDISKAEVMFLNDENILSAWAISDTQFEFLWDKQVFQAKIRASGPRVEFYPSGLLKSTVLIDAKSMTLPILGKSTVVTTGDYGIYLRLYEDRSVAEAGGSVPLDLQLFKGDVRAVSISEQGVLEKIKFHYYTDPFDPRLPLVQLHGRWFPINGDSLKFDEHQRPLYEDQALLLTDAGYTMQCGWAEFNSNGDILACKNGAIGFWKTPDGKTWELVNKGSRPFNGIKVEFFADGSLSKFFTLDEVKNANLRTVKKIKEVSVWPSGAVKSVHSLDYITDMTAKVRGQWYEAEFAEFTETGLVAKLHGSKCGSDGEVTFSTKHGSVSVIGCSKTEVFPDTGYLKAGKLSRQQTLTTANGTRTFAQFADVEWEEDGNATLVVNP
ncbi:hypothetical protein [Bdellovibrio sp. HCB337]|uniref:hypothetical protein n=1 Tax=Bdellovibrio sp. HCB337 TaxID=3394358 RepID=UPI0039A6F7AA